MCLREDKSSEGSCSPRKSNNDVQNPEIRRRCSETESRWKCSDVNSDSWFLLFPVAIGHLCKFSCRLCAGILSVELCELQGTSGNLFFVENPVSASSWMQVHIRRLRSEFSWSKTRLTWACSGSKILALDFLCHDL